MVMIEHLLDTVRVVIRRIPMRKEPEALGVVGGELRGKHGVGLVGGKGKQEETNDECHGGSEGCKTSQRET